MEEDRRVAFCSHCGNESTQQKIFQYDTATKIWDDVRENLLGESPCTYFLATCETCRLPLLYHIGEDTGVADSTASEFQSAELVWPQSCDLDYVVPDIVAHCYRTAARLRESDPNAYALQVRRALEALCDDRGADKGTLQNRLQQLAFRNEIPRVLAEMGELLRVLGNVGAHDHQHHLSASDARVIDEFFRTIIDYVYLYPSRIGRFRAQLTKFGTHFSAGENEPSIAPVPEKKKYPIN